VNSQPSADRRLNHSTPFQSSQVGCHRACQTDDRRGPTDRRSRQ